MSLAVTWVDVFQITLGGLASGCIYALILLGILLSYQVSKAVNFAYGQLGMLAAFGAWWLYERNGFPVWLAIAIGVLAAGIVAAGEEALILRRLPESLAGFDLVITLGVLLMLTALGENVFGNNAYSFTNILNRESLTVRGVFVNGNDLLVIGLTIGLLAATYLVLARTSAGMTIRAVADQPSIAKTVGLNVNRVRTATWAVSGLLAALAGIIVASRLNVDAFYMTPFLIKAFIAGIIGGLDRFLAPLAIAIGLGIYEAWSAFLLGSDVQTPAVFVLIIVLLALAPRRFLEERHEARA